MKKIIAVLLCLTTLLALCVPALAGSKAEDRYAKYKGKTYLCLGDSVAAGTSNPGYVKERFAFVNQKNVVTGKGTATYPWYVLDAIGADKKTSFNGAHAGMRTYETLIALTGETDEAAYPYDFTENFFSTDLYGGEGCLDMLLNPESYNGRSYREALADAALVTVNLGSNDILGTLLYHFIDLLTVAYTKSEYTGVLQPTIDAVEDMPASDALKTLLDIVQNTMASTDEIVTFMDHLSDAVKNNAVAEFFAHWDPLISYVLDNSTADVVVVGVFNPVRSILGMTPEALANMDDTTRLLYTLIDNIAQSMIDTMNYQMQYGSPYRDRYVYADVSFVADDLVAGHQGTTVDTNTTDTVHPDDYTHERIAKAILKAMESFCQHKHTHTLFEKKATLFSAGYSGDVFCSDCGVLLKQGSVTDILGREVVTLPKGSAYAVATSVAKTVVSAVTSLFKKK